MNVSSDYWLRRKGEEPTIPSAPQTTDLSLQAPLMVDWRRHLDCRVTVRNAGYEVSSEEMVGGKPSRYRIIGPPVRADDSTEPAAASESVDAG
jgi:hypothetical protein